MEHPPNRLINEKSPYLLQHARNPVDWYPWGDEAFEKARREDKPIFLSVGYSTCHWCHVMERESFEDPEIAKVMNEHFVCIKVDREERPDVDRVYMTFVQATTGGGGWPMSVWLAPDLKPFVGGTYFPPQDQWGRPGFKPVLLRIAEAWKKDRENIVGNADRVVKALQSAAQTEGGDNTMTATNLREKAFKQFVASYDGTEGGFGGAPKFPRASAFNFLFRVYARDPDAAEGKRALEMTLFTLRKMADGGIHDHLGGGFHRYATDAEWHVPHFEKMLYDQAQLAECYLTAWQITREPLFEQTARSILDYVRRDMTGKDGGFYSAEDADSVIAAGSPEHAEGAFYVWTKDQIDGVLGEEAAPVFSYYYGVEANGNVPSGSDPHGELTGKNVLIQRHSIEVTARKFGITPEKAGEALAEGRKQLFEMRAKRPRPHLDDKIITAWNGLMISAFARAASVLEAPEYCDAATRAARFLREHLCRESEETLLRSYRQGAGKVDGFADDYAFLIRGLLDLYEASFEVDRLGWAMKLQERQDTLFWDPDGGGYFSTAGTDQSVLLRIKEGYDGAEPSPNSIAVENLVRLASMCDRNGWRDRAARTLRAFEGQLRRMATAMPQMLASAESYQSKLQQIVIAGKSDAPDTIAMLREVHRHYLPGKVLILADGGDGQEFFASQAEFLKGVHQIDNRATAFVCNDFVCQLPTTDAGKLGSQLTGEAPPGD